MMRYSVVCLFVLAATASAQDMPLSQVLIPGEGWHHIEHKSRLSCLSVDGDGNLLVADGLGESVHKFTKDGFEEFAKTGSVVKAMGLAPDGVLYTLEQASPFGVEGDNLYRRATGAKAEKVATGVVEFAISSKGDIYYTVHDRSGHGFKGYCFIHRLGEKKPVAKGILSPAGLAFWRDGGTLVAGEADGDKLLTFRVGKDGRLDAQEDYYTLRTRGRAPSGVKALTLDADGRLYAATTEGVQVFDPTGRMCGVINAPTRAPVTALAFAGPARDQMYVVCGGKLYARKTKVKGFVPVAKKAK